MLLLIVASACIAGTVYAAAEFVTMPERSRRALVRRAARYGAARVPLEGQDRASLYERLLAPTAARLARLHLRVNPREDLGRVQQRLLAAGMGTVSPSGFLAAKAGLTGAGILFGVLIWASSGGLSGFAATVAFAAGGWVLPGYLVGGRARRRRDQVQAGLPDALDLLAVSVEAGMGFDAAISKLTEHMQGPLIDEFELALGEIRVGEGRSEALKRIAERVPAQEMASFVRSIVQADQLGISLGRILRVQAADARNKRQAAAEEKAMKAPIKMLFPLVLFIFPAMFIVVLGPAFLNLSQLCQF